MSDAKPILGEDTIFGRIYYSATDYAAIEAECDRLRAQVSALQSDANSWQSGYDKGREDGAKAADGWKAQHARDSAELRRLCAERDQLRAELDSIRRMAECGTVQNWLKLSDEEKANWFALMVGTDSENKRLRAELSALKAQQEPVAWRVTGAGGLTVTPEYPKWADDDSRLLIESLYTAPQPAPAQDVAGLVEAAKKADDALSALVRNDQPLETLARKYGSDWSSAIDKVRTELVIQIAAHDKQSGGSV